MKTDDFSFEPFSNLPFYVSQNARLLEMAPLPSGVRVVDLACGTGSVTRLLVERLRDARASVIIAIDHSAAALRQAMENLKDVRDAAVQFVQSQVEQLSETVMESVDAVVYCNAIHYVKDKDRLLAEVSKTLRPGGTFVFNTAFFEGATPDEAEFFSRKWMFRAARILRRDYGLSPTKAEKVEARIQLTPGEYRDLLERHDMKVVKQEIDSVKVPLEGWVDISRYRDFIAGVMPGVPLQTASAAMVAAAKQVFEEMKLEYVPRNWLDVVAVRV